MEKNNNAPIIDNPVLIDKVIGNIQLGLIDNIGWLDKAFGRAQRLVKIIEGKKYFTPNVYTGIGNDYQCVSPDSNIGNFCFFWVDDPQTLDWVPNEQGVFKIPISIIFWFDLRRVYNDGNNRNTEALKLEVIKTLNGGFLLRNGRIRIKRIYEQAEHIYKGFTLDEVSNQFLMHPFGGFRLEGELTINEPC